MPSDDRLREALGARSRAFVPDDGAMRIEAVPVRNPPTRASFGWVGASAEVRSETGGVAGVLVLAVDARRLKTLGTVAPQSLRLFRWEAAARRFTPLEESGCDEGAYVWGRIDAEGTYAAIGLNTDPAVLATIRTLAAMREPPGMAEAGRKALHARVCELVLCAAEDTEDQKKLCAACRALPNPFDLPEFELLPLWSQLARRPGEAPPSAESRPGPPEVDAIPPAGRVSAMALDPVAPSRLYVAAESGGLWRLDDLEDGLAARWVALGDLDARVVRAVAVAAPVESQIVYVADESGQVFRSTDRGATWSRPGEVRFRHVWRIIVDPAEADRVYVASGSEAETDPQAEGETGLWESADGGRTWMEVLTGDTIDAAVDPQDGSILYAAVRDEGLCMSVRSGREWVLAMPFVSTLAHGGSMIRIALGRATVGPGRTVAVRFGQEIFMNRRGGRSRREPDGGPWVSIGQRGGDGHEGRQVVAVDPFDDDVLVTGGETLLRTETSSAPGGGEWTRVTGPPRRTSGPQWLEFDVVRKGVVYHAHTGGIQRSADGGRTWAALGVRDKRRR
jgi:hypothetical protein